MSVLTASGLHDFTLEGVPERQSPQCGEAEILRFQEIIQSGRLGGKHLTTAFYHGAVHLGKKMRQ